MEAARGLMGLTSPPTALVTANNQMTLGAMLAAKEAGLGIPEDISLVGFDDPEWAPLTDPPLTALAQPTYEMGVRAARLLLDRIEAGPGVESRKVLLQPWLIARESTARLNGRST
jgi:DNA-binding LacI/PurR family transcriptional regulator